MRNFRNYDVWIDGIDFSVDIYKITENFPKKKLMLYVIKCKELQCQFHLTLPKVVLENR